MLEINEKSPASCKFDDDPLYLSLLLLKRPKECPIIKCYFNRCAQNADCRAALDCCFSTRLDSTDKYFCTHDENQTKNFPGATSVISRPATCQVAIAGEHFFAAKLVRRFEVVLCWKLLFSTRSRHSIRFST